MTTNMNWGKLKTKLDSEPVPVKVLKKRQRMDTEMTNKNCESSLLKSDMPAMKIDNTYVKDSEKQKYIALDCEMVGIGPSGKTSALARVAIVNFDGESIYDKFVRPKGYVTDFRTKYSGVRSKNLRDAISFEQCQAEVAEQLRGRVLVGHALKNDLDALLLSHHPAMVRDTARYRPYMRPAGRGGGKWRPRALRDLTREHLGLDIQKGEHDPNEDARCAMMLFRRQRQEWESTLLQKKRDSRKASANSSAPPPSELVGTGLAKPKPKSIFDPDRLAVRSSPALGVLQASTGGSADGRAEDETMQPKKRRRGGVHDHV